MKLLTGLLCAILMSVATVASVAQTYCVNNNSPVAITVYLQRTCGTIGVSILPFSTWCAPLPFGCSATGIVYGFTFYPIGYSGPLPPPNPPSTLTVFRSGATFM